MTQLRATATIGLMLSGGLDSSILLGHLLKQGHRVQPIYLCGGLCWEREELAHVERFLAAMRQARLAPLVKLDLPLGDLYGRHWSLTGLRSGSLASLMSGMVSSKALVSGRSSTARGAASRDGL